MGVLAWIRDQISEWRSGTDQGKSPCFLLCERDLDLRFSSENPLSQALTNVAVIDEVKV